MVYLSIAEGIKGHHFICIANNQLFTATTTLFDEKLFPKCKTGAPKPITQVMELVSIDTPSQIRNIPWDNDNDNFPVAKRPPFHLNIPPYLTCYNLLPVGIGRGNPGVEKVYPYPYPEIPLPLSQVWVFQGWGGRYPCYPASCAG
jgi:hypothetical protein